MRILISVISLILIGVSTIAQEESSNSFITYCRIEIDPKTKEYMFTEFDLTDLWSFTKRR